jgi:TatD DNase family protein
MTSSAMSADLMSYCSFGIHPWFLNEENADSQLQQLEILLKNNTIVAIGEVGFDAVRGAEMKLQEGVFEEIITLSEKYQKPLIIHCVKAWEKLLALHKIRKIKQTWIIHGFHAHHELALQLNKRGILLSFGAELLTNSKLQDVFSKIPIDSLFLESDDAAVNIVDIYQAAAGVRRMDVETFKSTLFENFKKIISVVA